MRGKNLILLVAPAYAGGFFKKRVSLGIKDLDSYPQPVQALLRMPDFKQVRPCAILKMLSSDTARLFEPYIP